MAPPKNRSRKPLLLAQSPLVLVLAQVRIAPVLKMDTYIPDIQERLRSAGYPRFDTEHSRVIEFGPGPEPRTAQSVRWLFRNLDGTDAVTIAPDFIVLETSNYSSFESFIGEIERVVTLVADVAKVEHIERMGLRYVDLVDCGDGSNLDVLLKPGLLGLSASDLGLTTRLHRVEILAETGENQRLVVRVSQNLDGVHLPPDLRETALEYSEPIAKKGEVTTLLDIDHFMIRRTEMIAAEFVDSFWTLHEMTDVAFRESVTGEALTEWGLEEGK